MSTAWVAGTVRARALARRRLGAGAARALARSDGLPRALVTLAATPYGHDVHPGMGLAQAQRAVGATLLWNLRVLAGWLPRAGADVVRLVAAGFEVANLDEHLAALHGEPADAAYALGTLDTAWQRLSAAPTSEAVAEVLATSGWRLRGVGTRRGLQLGLRLAWADAVVAGVPEAADWARAGAALLVLREVALEDRRLSPGVALRAGSVLGPAVLGAVEARHGDLAALRAALPRDTGWVLEGVERVEDLWRAEAGWALRVEREGFALLRTSGYDRRPLVGALAVLAVDAWRVRAALESAARGGAGSALEAFDGVA